MKRIISILILSLAAAAAFAEPDFKALIKEVDDTSNFGVKDFSAVWTIVSQKPDEKESLTEVQIFRRDERDQLVYLILRPSAEKGKGMLKVDDNVWMYDPESGKFNHSTFKDNVGGSDAKNSDLKNSSLSDDYDILKAEEGKLGSYAVWIITLKAKNQEVTYDTLRLSILKDKPIVLREEDFSLNGKLMRVSSYPPPYQQVGTKFIPSKIVIEDKINVGEKSIITISKVSTATLADSTFTKAFLEKASN